MKTQDKLGCRDHYWQSCRCYDYRCPGPEGDPRGCSAPYKYDLNAYHWAEPGEPCAQCDQPIPDIGCIPKITPRLQPKSNQLKLFAGKN